MNQHNELPPTRLEASDAPLRVSAAGTDAFGHLHFDRVTRSWWAHDDTPVQLDPQPAAGYPSSRCA